MTASRFLGAAPAALLILFLLLACRPGSAERPIASAGPAMPADAKIQVLATHDREITLDKDRATVTVQLPAALPEAAGDEGKRLGLYLEGVRPAGGAYFEVYAGLPAGAKADPSSPHYLGTLSSYGPRGGEGATVGYDITQLWGTLASQEKWDGKLDLTFVRRGLEGAGAREQPAPMRVKRVKIVRE